MANNATWNATLVLSAKFANTWTGTFSKATGTVNKLGHSVQHLSGHFLKLTAAMLGARLAGDVMHHVFYGIGEQLRGATENAWSFDKAMQRIKSSFLANQRVGWNGAHASDGEKVREFGVVKKGLMDQAVSAGIRPDVLASTYNAMAQQGMTPGDINTMMPGISNMLVAKDVHDPERGGEIGKSLALAVMKNRPLHLTRQGVGTALGLDEKAMTALFHTVGLDGKKGESISVQERVAKVAQLINIQYKAMAQNINKTEEGVARTAEVWQWMYQYDVGEKMKDLQLEWYRFVNLIAPLAKPAFENLLEDIKKWAQGTADVLTKFWVDHGKSITMWWNQSVVPGLKDAFDALGDNYTKLMSLFGGSKDDKFGPTAKIEKFVSDSIHAFTWMEKEIGVALDAIKKFEDEWPTMSANIQKWGDIIWKYTAEFWQKIVDKATEVWNWLVKLWDQLDKLSKSPIVTWLTGMMSPLDAATESWKKLKEAMPEGNTWGGLVPNQGDTGSGLSALSGGQGYAGSNWGKVSEYDDAFREASRQSGIPFNTLKGIALQEGVDPRDNNPMGISTGANGTGADHFSKEEAKQKIIDLAKKPYMQGFRDGASPEERARAYRTYSPPGAYNDVKGTNAQKQSETDKIIDKLNGPPITQVIHFHGVTDRDLAQRLEKVSRDALSRAYV